MTMTPEDEKTVAWLRLARVPGVGPVTGLRLVKGLGSVEAVFASGRNDRLRVEGVPESVARAVADPALLDQARKDLEVCREKKLRVLTWEDADYPSPLRNVFGAPLVLFIRGQWQERDQDAVAMVGCRSPDPYGESMAVSIAAGLARRGVTVVSGLARGIDGMAQKAALKAGGRTIAVLGTGADVVYPEEHRGLYQAVIENGAVMSEFPPGAAAEPGNFPRRNRIISGLSRGVVMVQAMSEKSGALITVRHALEQDRQVYAVPGNAGSRGGRIGNLLIKQGAKMVESAEDVLLDLFPLGSVDLGEKGKSEDRGPEGRAGFLSDLQARVYALVPVPNEGTVEIDVLARASGLAMPELLGAMLELELAGLVRALPGKRYVRIGDG